MRCSSDRGILVSRALFFGFLSLLAFSRLLAQPLHSFVFFHCTHFCHLSLLSFFFLSDFDLHVDFCCFISKAFKHCLCSGPVGTLLHLRRFMSYLIFHLLSVYTSIELEREQIISLQSFHNYLVIQKQKTKTLVDKYGVQEQKQKKTSHATMKPYLLEVIIRKTLHYSEKKKNTEVQPGKIIIIIKN